MKQSPVKPSQFTRTVSLNSILGFRKLSRDKWPRRARVFSVFLSSLEFSRCSRGRWPRWGRVPRFSRVFSVFSSFLGVFERFRAFSVFSSVFERPSDLEVASKRPRGWICAQVRCFRALQVTSKVASRPVFSVFSSFLCVFEPSGRNAPRRPPERSF